MELKFEFNSGTSWIVEVDGKFKIGCDPSSFMKIDRKEGEQSNLSNFKDVCFSDNVKLWVLTRKPNFYKRSDIALIHERSTVICRPSHRFKFHRRSHLDVSFLDWDQRRSLLIQNYYVEIEAIPVYDNVNKISSFFSRKRNGYMISIRRGNAVRKICIADSKVYNDEVDSILQKHNNIDIFVATLANTPFLCENDLFDPTMSALQKYIMRTNPQECYVVGQNIPVNSWNQLCNLVQNQTAILKVIGFNENVEYSLSLN